MFRAGAGEFSDLTAIQRPHAIEFTDANVAVTARPGCTTLPSGTVSCDGASRVDAHMGDQPDTAHVSAKSCEVALPG